MNLKPKKKQPSPQKWVPTDVINEEYVEQLEKDHGRIFNVLRQLIDSIDPKAVGDSREEMIEKRYVGSKGIPSDESIIQALEILENGR